VWRDGKLNIGKKMRAAKALSLARDVLANLWWFSKLPKQDVFVGVDNVNALCGILLRSLGRVKRVVYYVIDYTPQRFKNPFLNFVYHAIDRFAERRSDEIWNISQRISDVRVGRGVPAAKNKVVGSGVDFGLIEKPEKRNYHDMVIMAHLTEDKGVQLAINAMRRIRERVPDSRLLIIGGGPYEPVLRQLVRESQLEDAVQFLGVLQREQLYVTLPQCGIGLAPYLDRDYSITYYADPGKPKEYLACALPVITTDVPWIAQDIASVPMGIAIKYDEDALVEAAVRLMSDRPFYDLCGKNAEQYMKQHSWEHIFQAVLHPQS
jgi:glycosyltransferase involved in cell wall biosynthesis